MKILFFGSGDLSQKCLRELIYLKENIIYVILNDYNNKEIIKLCENNDIKFASIPNINQRIFIDRIKELKPDIILSIFYHQIFSKEILEIPKLVINLHFSLLPEYRGGYPQVHAMIDNKTFHGVTIHKMDEGIDTGDIISQKKFVIFENDTGKDMFQRCVEVGFELFKETWKNIKKNKITFTKQDLNKGKFHYKKIPNNRQINWDWDANHIDRFIRALTFPPHPFPHTYYKNNKIEIIKIKVYNSGKMILGKGGKILKISNRGIEVETGQGRILIKKVKPENDIEMSGYDFSRYYNLKVNEQFK